MHELKAPPGVLANFFCHWLERGAEKVVYLQQQPLRISLAAPLTLSTGMVHSKNEVGEVASMSTCSTSPSMTGEQELFYHFSDFRCLLILQPLLLVLLLLLLLVVLGRRGTQDVPYFVVRAG